MVYERRYVRNTNTFSLAEFARIKESKVCVIGCGGIGGYAIEMLARLGIGHLTVVDGDIFDETNLNRQLLCEEGNLGESKAEAAEKRVRKINSEVGVSVVKEYITEENCRHIISGCDIVVEALDNMSVRKMLAKACADENIPMVHGAMAGWYAQVAVIAPGDNALNKIYPCDKHKGAEKELGNPSFTPALVASLEVTEAIKVLLHKGVSLESRMLSIDLLLQEYDVFRV